METQGDLSSTPDELAMALSRGVACSTGIGAMEWVQTHISHVFLAEDRVFKLRKAVCLPFLDFSSRDARNADCLNEIELNSRLAPSVYLGIAPLLSRGSDVEIGPIRQSLTDPHLEHVVVMRRLSPDCDALSLLERGQLNPAHLESVSTLLAKFHAAQGLGRPAPWNPEDWLERSVAPILASLSSIVQTKLMSPTRSQALEARVRNRLDSLRAHLENRRLDGRAVDGHGDLHLDHVWFEEGESKPLLIDCLEFNEDLRRIDCASDVAFLAMDLRYRERADLAEWFLSSYAMRSDDYGLFSVVDFYSVYRALVRAKVAGLAALQQSIPNSQRERARESADGHFSLAEALLEENSSKGLIVLCGSVGSGKSTVTRQLAQSGEGIAIASDRVRKSISGIPATTHVAAATDAGIYQPGETVRVYRELLERASAITQSGRVAILDASFATREQRSAARAWAAERGLRVRLIEARCDSEVAHDRLTERARVGADPSDAGPDFLPISEGRFEPPDEWPSSERQVVWTDRQGWQKEILRGASTTVHSP